MNESDIWNFIFSDSFARLDYKRVPPGVSGDHRFNSTMVGVCSSCDIRVSNLVILLNSLIVVIILASN